MSDVLTLLTGGKAFAGWKSIHVQRSMEHCAGGFRVAVSELWHGVDVASAIEPGASCEVKIGNDTVITGYVDTVELSIDAASHSADVSGRDKTADLVDCSAVRKAGQWRGLRIEQIAAELAAPFGIKVRADVDTGKPLTSFSLQEGESAFEAIERAARIRAVLPVSDGQGGLVLTRAGTRRAGADLVMGSNLLSASLRVDLRDRFSSYLAKGQVPGTDWSFGKAASQVFAKAADQGVTRYRPLILTSDCPDLAASLVDRVRWEANVRAARSVEVEAVVQGWRHGSDLWAPNTLVKVFAEELRLTSELLITSVEFSLDERGSTTRLVMTRPDAFKLLPMKETRAVSVWSDPSVIGRRAGEVPK